MQALRQVFPILGFGIDEIISVRERIYFDLLGILLAFTSTSGCLQSLVAYRIAAASSKQEKKRMKSRQLQEAAFSFSPIPSRSDEGNHARVCLFNIQCRVKSESAKSH